MVLDPLETLATDQQRWSITANRLKEGISQARWIVLVLLIVGAFLETLASQLGKQSAMTQIVGYAGVAALAVVAVVRQWKLGREITQAWLLARAASEAFKREMLLYRAKAGPYSAANAPSALFDRRDQILSRVQPVQKYSVDPNAEDVKVPGSLDIEGYVNERVRGQVEYYRRNSARYSKAQGSIGRLEFWLAVAAVLLSVAATATGKQGYGPWVAVITTITGAFGAHVLAQRYEQLTVSYRATADRLVGILGRWEARPQPTLPDLVEAVESVLGEENQAWIAGADDIMKDSAGAPPPGAHPEALPPAV
jgi:uncharacterized membrane protein YhaH (DUF805 family)